MHMPRLRFGNCGRKRAEGKDAIHAALEIGDRHRDTAQTYDTEREVGEALRRSGLPRSEVFVATKVAEGGLRPDRVLPFLERSLEAMGLIRVDFALILWLVRKGVRAAELYLTQIGKAQDWGLAERIGVSNFTIARIDEAIGVLVKGATLTHQVGLNPWFRNRNPADH